MRWTSASHQLSFVVSTAVIASPMQRHASSNWPSSEYAQDRMDKYHGRKCLAPVDRCASIPMVSICTPYDGLPVKADRQPLFIPPNASQNGLPFSSASSASSLVCMLAAA